MKFIPTYHQTKSVRILLVGLVIALLYNVWPIGYILDYPVARFGLVSDLEAIDKPYNWFFVLSDVLTSLISLILIRYLVKLNYQHTKYISVLVLGIGLFAFCNFLSAVVPLNCNASILTCGIKSNQIFGFHNILSVVADLGVMMSLIGSGLLWREKRLAIRHIILLLIVSILWAAIGIIFLLKSLQGTPAQLEQQLFVVLTGIAIFIVAITCFMAAKLER